MLDDDRIPIEIDSAIESLDAVRYVFRRDNTISKRYVLEKLTNAKYVISWLEHLAEEGGEE